MSILTRIQSFARTALGIRDRAAAPAPMTAGEVLRGRWGRWDSKVSDRMNQAHWAKVTGLPINAELAYASNWLRAQAEYEISSNPVMEGLVNSHITDVVGPEGPAYRVTSSDAEYNALREKLWKRWARQAGANRQLSLVEILASWVRSLWKAGEFGTQMIDDAAADGPVKMRLLPVHMHRLMTPPEMLGDPEVALGVRRDENRNPVSYYISEPYIFGPFEVYTGEFYEVKYDDFIHGYELTEEDQVRGVPWLASSLDVVAQLRDWDKSMLDAAEAVSKTGVLWQLKNPSEPRAVDPAELDDHAARTAHLRAARLRGRAAFAHAALARPAELPRGEEGRDRPRPLHPLDHRQPRQFQEQLFRLPLRQPALLADRGRHAELAGADRPRSHRSHRHARSGTRRRTAGGPRRRGTSLGLDQTAARRSGQGVDRRARIPAKRDAGLERGGRLPRRRSGSHVGHAEAGRRAACRREAARHTRHPRSEQGGRQWSGWGQGGSGKQGAGSGRQGGGRRQPGQARAGPRRRAGPSLPRQSAHRRHRRRRERRPKSIGPGDGDGGRPGPPQLRAAVAAAKEEIRRAAVEHSIVFSAGGKEVGRRTGTTHTVRVPEKWIREHPGAVLVHNHPGGNPPSPSDTQVLHLGADHAAVVTAGHDHTIRLAAGKTAGDAKNEYASFSAAWAGHLNDSRRIDQIQLLAAVANGRLSREEALESYREADSDRQHRAWLDIGHRFGIEYTRVEHHAG